MGKSVNVLLPTPVTFTSVRVGHQMGSRSYTLTATITRIRDMTGQTSASVKPMVRSTAFLQQISRCGLRQHTAIVRLAEAAQTCQLGCTTERFSFRDVIRIPKSRGNTNLSVPISTISIAT